MCHMYLFRWCPGVVWGVYIMAKVRNLNRKTRIPKVVSFSKSCGAAPYLLENAITFGILDFDAL